MAKRIYVKIQNNSGGSFMSPGIVLCILTEEIYASNIHDLFCIVYPELYIDGPNCPCCGDRWGYAEDYSVSIEEFKTTLYDYEYYITYYANKEADIAGVAIYDVEKEEKHSFYDMLILENYVALLEN